MGFGIIDKFIEQEKRSDFDVALYNLQLKLDEPNRSNFGLFNVDMEKLEDYEKMKLL